MKISYISIPVVNIQRLSATAANGASIKPASGRGSASSLCSSPHASPSSSSLASTSAASNISANAAVAVGASKKNIAASVVKLWRQCGVFRYRIPSLSLIIGIFMLVSMSRFTLIRYPLDAYPESNAQVQMVPRRLVRQQPVAVKAQRSPNKMHTPSHLFVSEFEETPSTGNGTDLEALTSNNHEDPDLAHSIMRPFPLHLMNSSQKMTEDEAAFWKQPDSQGFKPCIRFTDRYRQASPSIVTENQRFIMITANGGLNQQRNQIVDAVIIARIMEAALVLPVLEVNYFWGDDSEFSDIFDVDHFKQALKDDVRIVSTLPSSHLRHFHSDAINIPWGCTIEYLRANLSEQLDQEGLVIIQAVNSKLAKDLPLDLQKLRCKVAFHALRFSSRIMELGNKLSQRMWEKGPYTALHLRLEKDVWVRSGCSAGLGVELDEEVQKEQKDKPYMLTASDELTPEQRKEKGFCPLNAGEVARLLKALGASRNTMFYWAGGEPLGGKEVSLKPFIDEFPNLFNKEDLALPGELEPFANKPSILAAIDYLICFNSDVFMNSHGGNMGHALQGHRAYTGHRKHISPNKRELVNHFANASLTGREFFNVVRESQSEFLGQPKMRGQKPNRDVAAFPVAECMCNTKSHEDS